MNSTRLSIEKTDVPEFRELPIIEYKMDWESDTYYQKYTVREHVLVTID